MQTGQPRGIPTTARAIIPRQVVDRLDVGLLCDDMVTIDLCRRFDEEIPLPGG